MNGYGFQGDIILEKLAEIDKVQEFYDAVDSDDFAKIKELLELVNIDQETIELVFKEIKNP
jgi:hypothetical protein